MRMSWGDMITVIEGSGVKGGELNDRQPVCDLKPRLRLPVLPPSTFYSHEKQDFTKITILKFFFFTLLIVETMSKKSMQTSASCRHVSTPECKTLVGLSPAL